MTAAIHQSQAAGGLALSQAPSPQGTSPVAGRAAITWAACSY
jgi:hypothetical protein